MLQGDVVLDQDGIKISFGTPVKSDDVVICKKVGHLVVSALIIMIDKYNLDYAVHPGEYIDELLEMYHMPQAELASRIHVSTKHLNQIIKGKANVTSTSALALETVLDRSAGYWLSLQAKFDEFSAREEKAASVLAAKEWLILTRMQIGRHVQNWRPGFESDSLWPNRRCVNTPFFTGKS